MRYTRWMAVVGALILVLLFVAACGGGNDTSSTTETTSAPGTSASSSSSSSSSSETTASTGASSTTASTGGTGTSVSLPDLKGQKLEVAAVWSGAEQANFQKVLDEFQKLTGAQVTFTSTGNDIATVLGTRLQGGNPPDIAMVPQPGLMRQLQTQGVLQPIDEVLGNVTAQNYDPLWKELGSVQGKQYGLLWKLANKSTVWYSKQAFNDAGVQPPKTWQEFLTTAQTISDSGLTPFSIGGADGWTLTDWFENVYLQTAGPDKYDQLTDHKIPWTDPSVKTALTELAKVFNGKLVAGGNQGALQVSFPQSVTQVFGDPRKAAIVFEGDFAAGVISSETKAKLGTDADYFPFPSAGSGGTAVVVGGDTAVLMKDSPGGKALMQFLAMPESSTIWVQQGGFTSPNKGVPASAYPDPILGRAAQDMANAQTVRFDMSDMAPAAFGGTPSQGEWKLLQDFLADPTKIDSIQQQLESAAAKAYGA